MFRSCLTTKSSGFTGENLFFLYVLSSRSENTKPVIRDHIKSSQMRNETPLQLLPEQV